MTWGFFYNKSAGFKPANEKPVPTLLAHSTKLNVFKQIKTNSCFFVP
jgi:hypothetical protein